MKIKSSNIITKRDALNKEITKYWKIIRQENIMSKAAVSAGMGSGFDLKALYNSIKRKGEARVKTKLYLQALNMGYTNFSEFKKDTNYENIYLLNEKKEEFVQLSMLNCMNPAYKSKMGKKIKTVETFSKEKLTALKKELTLEINALEKKIEDFNNDTELEISDIDSALLNAA